MNLSSHMIFFLLLLVANFAISAITNGNERQWLDPIIASEEDPDFCIQGEYGESVAGAKYGIQVVAMGDGNFNAYLLEGGLPGLGWKDGKSRTLLKGKRNGATIVFSQQGGGITGIITLGKFIIKMPDNHNYELSKINRKSPTLNASPPEGAVILFDGSSTSQWLNGKITAKRHLATGCTSKMNFADYRLHLEFRTPYMPFARGQKRGNSGIYHSGRWETQILDSFGLEVKDNHAGGIYSISKPRLNMCLPPLSWQTYDVEFKAAEFDDNSKRIAWPKITVKLNGVTVHEDLELAKNFTTSAPITAPLINPNGPVHLQNHNNPVVFRNIWIQPGNK